jgi:hypothetical protein
MTKGAGSNKGSGGFVNVGCVNVGRAAGSLVEDIANEVIHRALPGAPKVTETAVGKPSRLVDKGGPASAPITGPGCVQKGGCDK